MTKSSVILLKPNNSALAPAEIHLAMKLMSLMGLFISVRQSSRDIIINNA